MADVVVTTTNHAGQEARILLDDSLERHQGLIESLKRLVRREDLDSISIDPVEPVEKPKGRPAKAAE